jgi:hypothetical protein
MNRDSNQYPIEAMFALNMYLSVTNLNSQLIFSISGIISKMAIDRKKLTHRILSAVLMSLMSMSATTIPLVLNQPAQASYAAKWFDGNWNCGIRDRAVQMNWRMASDTPNSKYVGKFSDNGGPWTPISEVSSTYNTVNIRFDQRQSTWSLTYYPKEYSAQGSIILGRQKYPISCRKSNQSENSEPLKPEVEQPPVILNPRSEQPNSVDSCKQGYVWREASANDRVCVTPEVRTQARNDNAAAASRREPNGGPYGPDTCKQGYVWREATANDRVCVMPQVRSQAADDNKRAGERRIP